MGIGFLFLALSPEAYAGFVCDDPVGVVAAPPLVANPPLATITSGVDLGAGKAAYEVHVPAFDATAGPGGPVIHAPAHDVSGVMSTSCGWKVQVRLEAGALVYSLVP